MSVEEELEILALVKARAEKGEIVEVSEIRSTYQAAVDYPLGTVKSTAYGSTFPAMISERIQPTLADNSKQNFYTQTHRFDVFGCFFANNRNQEYDTTQGY